MTIGDIYYVLFRHKWKIALIVTLGLVAAVLVHTFWPASYGSEARLFIRYVLEANTAPGQVASDSRVPSAVQRGDSIMSTEVEILTSLDVNHTAALVIGPQKILAKAGGGTNIFDAVALMRKYLKVEVPYRSTVIHINYEHPDPDMVQIVLSRIIDAYLKKHAEVHGAAGELNDFLTQETDQLKSRLAQTEDALRKAKNKAGVISLEDSKKAYTEQVSLIRKELFNAEADLAERQSIILELKKILDPSSVVKTNEVNQIASTNAVKQLVATNEVKQLVATNAISSLESTNQSPGLFAKGIEYRRIGNLLDTLVKREQDLSLQFTGENAVLKNIREQIAANEKIKQQMEKDFPELLPLRAAPASFGESALRPRIDPGELARLTYASQLEQAKEINNQVTKTIALQSKIRVLNRQLEEVRKETAAMDDLESTITDLQRRKELEQANFKYFAASLEQARINEALSSDRVSNISKLQVPSAPYRITSKLNKILTMIILGSIAFALGLAFVLEFVLDQTLKHPAQVEAQLGLPLMLTIPASGLKAARKANLSENAGDSQTAGTEVGLAVNGAEEEIAPWEPNHMLRDFFEVLRDRLIIHFEVRKLTRKPKLVAVTSCATGAGATTIAAGLAASLSETCDGRVLLVDMNLEHGAAHDFYKGNLECGIDDALEVDKRDGAKIQENLYVVAEGTNSDRLPRFLPKRFGKLVPKLKASDYDYIIFDLPPITDISITPRLARFMDTILLVVESEKTDRDVIKRAAALMGESQANINVILNQSRSYLPERLQHEV